MKLSKNFKFKEKLLSDIEIFKKAIQKSYCNKSDKFNFYISNQLVEKYKNK